MSKTTAPSSEPADDAALARASWAGWIGKSLRQSDPLDGQRLRGMHAALSQFPAIADADSTQMHHVPPLWHWLYFHDHYPSHLSGRDGHLRLGIALPDFGDFVRMWGGSDIVFHAPLRANVATTRVSTIENITQKRGKSGTLFFVSVAHRLFQRAQLRVCDTHHIVYRRAHPHQASTAANADNTADAALAWKDDFTADPVLLFRYSALTYNSHRIHYDYEYATQVEHYPHLVVHGPLVATLALSSARNTLAPIAAVSFRLRAPAFVKDTLQFAVHRQDDDRYAIYARVRERSRLILEGTAQIAAS